MFSDIFHCQRQNNNLFIYWGSNLILSEGEKLLCPGQRPRCNYWRAKMDNLRHIVCLVVWIMGTLTSFSWSTESEAKVNCIAPQMPVDSSGGYSSPHSMGPLVGNSIPQIPWSKRQQVKLACINCRKACKKCDEERPCQRCQTYRITTECVDIPRKKRKPGHKRGPYAKTQLKKGKVADYALH